MSKSFKVCAILIILFIIGTIVSLGFLFKGMKDLSRKEATPIATERIEEPKVTEEEPKIIEESKEPVPSDNFAVVEGGLNSWGAVLSYCKDNPNFLSFLTQVTGLELEDVKVLAESESKGCNYKVKLLKGTCLVNSGKKDGEYFTETVSLDRDRDALLGPKGIPAILISCGNPVASKPAPAQPTQTTQTTPTKEDPILRTDNVSSIGVDSAELVGFIDPKGNKVVSWFEWGEGNALGQKTEEFTTTGNVSRKIVGLKPETNYSFRLAGKVGQESFYGQTRTFKTNAKPVVVVSEPTPPVKEDPVAITYPASSVGSSTAYFNGFLDSKGESLNSWFEWGTSQTDLRNKATIGKFKVSEPIAAGIENLKANTTYYFRLVIERGGEVFAGAVRSFTTTKEENVDSTPLLVKTNNAVSVTRNSAELVSEYQGVEVIEGIVAYFEYGISSNLNNKSNEQKLIRSSGTVETNIYGLQSNTKYSFRLVIKEGSTLHYGETRTLLTDK